MMRTKENIYIYFHRDCTNLMIIVVEYMYGSEIVSDSTYRKLQHVHANFSIIALIAQHHFNHSLQLPYSATL